MKARDKRNIIILAIVALILISGFLFIGVNSVNFRYALYRRIPKISQANKNIGPNKAVWYKVFFKLSPLYKLIILGIISPKNGIFPTVIIVTAQINETIANPTLTTKL